MDHQGNTAVGASSCEAATVAGGDGGAEVEEGGLEAGVAGGELGGVRVIMGVCDR